MDFQNPVASEQSSSFFTSDGVLITNHALVLVIFLLHFELKLQTEKFSAWKKS